MTSYVLDTNIISAIMNAHPVVAARFRAVNLNAAVIYLCPIVYFEVKRGLLARNATRKLLIAEAIFANFLWQDYTRADYEQAAVLWVRHRQSGTAISDADLLIGVFALQRAATLITHNTKDFASIGVPLEDWTSP